MRDKDRARHDHATIIPDKGPFQTDNAMIGTAHEKSPRINKELGKLSLTEKQSTILNFIEEHSEQVGFPPTIREIAQYFKISAKASHDHIKAIAKKGYIRLFPGSARGIELIRNKHKNEPEIDLDNLVSIPLLGSIAAGRPMLAEENIETHLTMPASLMPKSGEMFALRVKGDSMEKAGIHDGDIAVLKQVKDLHSEVKNGDIVAAMIDDEATLKRFIKTGNRVELHPENDSYQPIVLSPGSDNLILAKLAGIYRQYKT